MSTFFIIWLSLGFLAAIYSFGTLFVYFQKSFPNISNEEVSIDYVMSFICSFVILLIPLAVLFIVLLCEFNKHGWSIYPPQPKKPNSKNVLFDLIIEEVNMSNKRFDNYTFEERLEFKRLAKLKQINPNN